MTALESPRKDNQSSDSPTKRKRADTVPIPFSSNKRARLETSLNVSSAEDIKVLQAVESKYEVQVQSVISSSKIQKKVTSILQYLSAPPNSDATSIAQKARVAVLRAKASEAGKLISIAEIAKRELAKGKDDGRNWFQYISLGEELKEIPRDDGNTTIEETRLGDGEDDAGFETMKTPFERAIESQPRLRGVPIMSLFLSRASIEELKKRYGEQTNANPA
ncbi:hypothetical protein F4820DRAFT_211048 [Hypoxylon rubiginosum]|uniref:Uncharacterized protein n=1 Tax=Hypoxylon rubiginosum TaxID=110542 RepID=A0ACB9Z6Z6_9PEZI|nr:hypothetical protein F4820DRAFT_211048 [Hypoxylon rubiginosum]